MSHFSPTRLRTQRERAGLTREELCVAIDRGYRSLEMWERGLSEPEPPVIRKMALALDCTIADLCEPTRTRVAR